MSTTSTARTHPSTHTRDIARQVVILVSSVLAIVAAFIGSGAFFGTPIQQASGGFLAAEWAYAKPYASEAERTAAYETWLHHYNHHRSHTGIGGAVPSARVHNVTGKYS